MKSIKKLAVIMLSVMVLFGTMAVPAMAAAKSPAKQTFNNVQLKKKSTTYNGKTQKPSIKYVKDGNKTLTKGKDYVILYRDGQSMKTAGKKTVYIWGIGRYAGCHKTISYTINPAKQNVKVSKSSVAVNRGKATTIKLTKAKAAKATWTSSNSKYVKVNKNGKIAVMKNAKKGKYTVSVTVKLANHKTVTKKITVTVK